MRRQNNLKLRSRLNLFPEVTNERLLELGVEMCFRLFDHNRGVEWVRREERVLFALALRVCLIEVIPDVNVSLVARASGLGRRGS